MYRKYQLPQPPLIGCITLPIHCYPAPFRCRSHLHSHQICTGTGTPRLISLTTDLIQSQPDISPPLLGSFPTCLLQNWAINWITTPTVSIFVDNYYSSRHVDKLCCFPFPAGSNFNLPVSQLCHKINYYLNWHRRNKIKLFTTGPVPVTWPTPTTLVPIHQYNAFLSMTFIIILGMAKTVLQAQTDTG